jgi:hypothetical protein
MEKTAPDKKPGRLLSLYVPATLGVFTAALGIPHCGCELTRPQMLLGLATGGFILVFGVWWIVAMVCFHACHFVRGLFHHPN